MRGSGLLQETGFQNDRRLALSAFDIIRIINGADILDGGAAL